MADREGPPSEGPEVPLKNIQNYFALVRDIFASSPDEEIDSRLELTSSSSQKTARLIEVMDSVLGTLKPRERLLVRKRYKLDSPEPGPTKLDDLAKEIDRTKETTRKTIGQAMRTMRHPSRSERIRGVLEEET